MCWGALCEGVSLSIFNLLRHSLIGCNEKKIAHITMQDREGRSSLAVVDQNKQDKVRVSGEADLLFIIISPHVFIQMLAGLRMHSDKGDL